MTKNKAIMNWSGGKDSTLALYKILMDKNYQVETLFTTISHQLRRITMHGVREALLDAQAAALELPLRKLELPASNTMDLYNELMAKHMQEFKKQGITHSIFGDIHLEDLKKYRKEQLQQVGLNAVFPIWKQPVQDVVREFIDLGFKAVVVCASARYMDERFVGRTIDDAFIKDLPKEVDVCGENGEFHSFVYDGPIFKQPVAFELGEVIYKDYGIAGKEVNYDTGFYFRDLKPLNHSE